MRDEQLESPHIAVRLLNALKGFYTFKELEEKLHIPYQVLWRYTSQTTYPEKKRAKELLTRIEETKLIDKIFSRIITVNSYGYVETWKYIYNTRFLDLVSYKVIKFLGDAKISVIISFPEQDAPLAMVLSAWLNSRVCVAREEPRLDATKYLQANYISKDRGKMVTVYIPFNTIKKGETVLLVKNIVKNWQSLRAMQVLAETAGAEIWGAVAVVSVSDEWKENLEKISLKKVKILMNLQYSSSSSR